MTANIMMAGGKLELIVAMMLGVRSVVVVVVVGAAVGMDNHQLIGCTLGSVRYDFNMK